MFELRMKFYDGIRSFMPTYASISGYIHSEFAFRGEVWALGVNFDP
jgi:hypothetical protein